MLRICIKKMLFSHSITAKKEVSRIGRQHMSPISCRLRRSKMKLQIWQIGWLKSKSMIDSWFPWNGAKSRAIINEFILNWHLLFGTIMRVLRGSSFVFVCDKREATKTRKLPPKSGCYSTPLRMGSGNRKECAPIAWSGLPRSLSTLLCNSCNLIPLSIV